MHQNPKTPSWPLPACQVGELFFAIGKPVASEGACLKFVSRENDLFHASGALRAL